MRRMSWQARKVNSQTVISCRVHRVDRVGKGGFLASFDVHNNRDKTIPIPVVINNLVCGSRHPLEARTLMKIPGAGFRDNFKFFAFRINKTNPRFISRRGSAVNEICFHCEETLIGNVPRARIVKAEKMVLGTVCYSMHRGGA